MLKDDMNWSYNHISNYTLRIYQDKEVICIWDTAFENGFQNLCLFVKGSSSC